jgi:hypothetical protein
MQLICEKTVPGNQRVARQRHEAGSVWRPWPIVRVRNCTAGLGTYHFSPALDSVTQDFMLHQIHKTPPFVGALSRDAHQTSSRWRSGAFMANRHLTRIHRDSG